MIIKRLDVLISKCSLESLSTWGLLKTQNFSIFVGKGTGPIIDAPVFFTVSDIDFIAFDISAKSNDSRVILIVSFFIFNTCYLIIFETTPAPTVLPPSRIAKRRPSSMAIGAIRSTVMRTLSPGITISTPSGKDTEPVISVVLK